MTMSPVTLSIVNPGEGGSPFAVLKDHTNRAMTREYLNPRQSGSAQATDAATKNITNRIGIPV